MSKKKKIIIAVSSVIAILVVCLIIFLVVNNQSKTNASDEENRTNTRLSKVYEKMNDKLTYSFEATLDNENKMVIKRKNNQARKDLTLEGELTTQIVRDGNTYLLQEDTKKYYEYLNNELELTELATIIQDLINNQEPTKTQEELDGDKYECEEYKGTSYFWLEPIEQSINEEETTIKFYFKGNNLKYIKTTINDKEELLQVNIEYNVDDSEFEIPSEYQKG